MRLHEFLGDINNPAVPVVTVDLDCVQAVCIRNSATLVVMNSGTTFMVGDKYSDVVAAWHGDVVDAPAPHPSIPADYVAPNPSEIKPGDGLGGAHYI